MAQESKRGCGYRRVGAMYLCGKYTFHPCDRLPYLLDTCPACGGGIKISRGFTEINPLALFGVHMTCRDKDLCFMCAPTGEPAYIMGVGERYYPTPSEFMEEAATLGISKRIPHTWLPRGLKLGFTVIYLSHPKACLMKITHSQQRMPLVPKGEPAQPYLIESEELVFKDGIFSAFIPQRIEKLIWKSQATHEYLEGLKKRDITPVVIEDGDADHE